MGRLRVMLLFGSPSAEHDVSRRSAAAAARALDPDKYDVMAVGITTTGEWRLHAETQALLASGDRDALPEAFEVGGELLHWPAVGVTDAPQVDVVFPLLHGPYGEDGTVQGLCELAGIPCVGSGVVGSAIGMDKIAMKQAFGANGLPTARFVAYRDGHDAEATVARAGRELGFPCFVKPANMGSSVGVRKAHDAGELRAAIAHAAGYDEWVLVEEFVDGREIEVGVLGDDPPEASLPGEIVAGSDFLDYGDKYENDLATFLAPTRLSDDESAEARRLAVEAFVACRCEAMARVDMFLRPDGTFVLNELNTIPGFTSMSMYPKLWESTGVPYAKLLDRLIELALDRSARRAARRGRQR